MTGRTLWDGELVVRKAGSRTLGGGVAASSKIVAVVGGTTPGLTIGAGFEDPRNAEPQGNLGPYAGFVVAYKKTGKIAWARAYPAHAKSDLVFRALAMTPTGDLLVLGVGRGTATLGRTILLGERELFVARLSGKDGEPIWARALGVSSESSHVVSTTHGDLVVYLSGVGADDSMLSEEAGTSSVLILSQDSGATQWARSVHGSHTVRPPMGQSESKRSVFAMVTCGDRLRVRTTPVPCNDELNGDLLLELSVEDGDLLSHQRLGLGGDVTITKEELTVALELDGTLTVGDQEFEGTNDFLLAHFDSANQLLWAHILGGPGVQTIDTLTSDRSGNIIVVGRFYEEGASLGGELITDRGDKRMRSFVAKYSRDGAHLWSKAMPVGAETSVATDDSGHIAVLSLFNLSDPLFLGMEGNIVGTRLFWLAR